MHYFVLEMIFLFIEFVAQFYEIYSSYDLKV